MTTYKSVVKALDEKNEEDENFESHSDMSDDRRDEI